MANPYGIEQVSVPGLLQMYEGVKRSRLEDVFKQRQYERQAKADERQAKMDTRADEEYERGSKAREAIGRGAKPEEVIALDPETGFSYAKHAASLAKDKREEIARRADDVGSAAIYLSQLPEQQMAQQWDAVIDRLVGSGYTDLAAYKGKPNRAALGPIIAASQEAVKAYLQQKNAADDDRRADAQLGVSRGNLAVAQGNLSARREAIGAVKGGLVNTPTKQILMDLGLGN